MWRALVQEYEGVRELGQFPTVEAALREARLSGTMCAWALRADREVPFIEPRKPGEGRSWRNGRPVAGKGVA